MTMIYTETPVSEKPDKRDYYTIILPNGRREEAYWNPNDGWTQLGDEVPHDYFTHWLRPITVNGGLTDVDINKAAHIQYETGATESWIFRRLAFKVGAYFARTHYESLLATKEAEAVETAESDSFVRWVMKEGWEPVILDGEKLWKKPDGNFSIYKTLAELLTQFKNR